MHGAVELVLMLAFLPTAVGAYALWRNHSRKRLILAIILAIWPVFAFLIWFGKDFAKAATLPTAVAVTIVATVLGASTAALLHEDSGG